MRGNRALPIWEGPDFKDVKFSLWRESRVEGEGKTACLWNIAYGTYGSVCLTVQHMHWWLTLGSTKGECENRTGSKI